MDRLGDTGSLGPAVLAAIGRLGVPAAAWTVETSADGANWVTVTHRDAVLPSQGWKLHVSASVPLARETLDRVLPVLLARRLAFKLAASLDDLALLNEGRGSLSQVGKFVTVYPPDETTAVRLAAELDAATRGLRGPRPLSDRPLHPGSVVHYRYGSFGGVVLQRPTGEIAFGLTAPDGSLVPDVRGLRFDPPPWAADPFVAAGVAAADDPPPAPLLADRFLVVGRLHSSARGGVLLAVDLDRTCTCVLKRAAGGAVHGRDKRELGGWLRHEAEVLGRLRGEPGFSSTAEVVVDGDDLLLVLDDVGTATLEERVAALNAAGRTLPADRVVDWGRQLATLLAAVHRAGFVYRDLKSTNVVVDDGDRLHLLDFELARPPGEEGGAPGAGTRGYQSPQQAAGRPPTVADDVYGLGAVLAFLATGAEPSMAPRPLSPLDRPLALLNPSLPPALAAVVGRCLDADPRRRYPTMAAVAAALEDALEPAPPPPPRPATGPPPRQLLDLCRRLGDSLCRLARPADGEWVRWPGTHPVTQGVATVDLHAGDAGVVLALAELVADLAVPEHADVLSRGAAGLLQSPRPAGGPLPGLFVGEAGVAAALLRAGQVLGDPALVRAAAARAAEVATLPHGSPDLFNGSAGRLVAHLLVWDETGDPAQLGAAVAAGERLLATAEEAGDRALRWTIPEGYDGLSGQAYAGYAHGAAGIGDALLDLAEATGEERWLDGARGAARWLARLALPALDDGRGLAWPVTEGGALAAPFWCHGAGGIARFLLHATDLDLLPEVPVLARGAAASVAGAARWAPPPVCHGLAGSVDVLLDAHQILGEPSWLAAAADLGRLLAAWAVDDGTGVVVPSDSRLVVSPSYSLGYGGVALTLLRLAQPGARPSPLSRAGFRTGERAGRAIAATRDHE